MCCGIGRADEEVVRRAELRHERLEALGVSVGQLLRLDAERVGGVGDRLAVLIGARQEEHVLAALAVMACDRVDGDRRIRVPQVRRRVDVVDRGSHIEGHCPPRLLAHCDGTLDRSYSPSVRRRPSAPGTARSRSSPSVSPRPSQPGAAGHRRRQARAARQAPPRAAGVGRTRSMAAPTTSTISPRGALLAVVLRQLRRASAADFLVQLRQLPAHRQRAIRVALGQLLERGRESPRRLERHERLLRAREQTLPLGALAREEPDEAPALGRQGGGHERAQHRARPRQHLHRAAPLRQHARTSAKPGSEISGMPASLTRAPPALPRASAPPAHSRERVRCARGS